MSIRTIKMLAPSEFEIMLKTIKEIALAKKYRYEDKEIGLLRRVSGLWKVDVPDIDIDVPIKLEGSDRFGPNRNALSSYKRYRHNIPELWKLTQELMVKDLKSKKIEWDAESTIFNLSEVLVSNIKESGNDIVFAFQIEQDGYSLYSGLIKEGQVKSYERLSYK